MSDQKKRPFFKRLSKAHDDRKAVMRGEYVDSTADRYMVASKANFENVEAFYEANPARRAGLAAVGRIDDGELHWSISWCSDTSEVIGLAASWLDANNTDALPAYVLVLGTAATEQAANHATAMSDTLETLRDRLDN